MWKTPEGNRVLAGAEAELIAAAIVGVVEHIREESSDCAPQCEYGISLFDDLAWTQRLATLDLVATHLLTTTPDTLELTAVNEAAVGALFEYLRDEVDREIDDVSKPTTRCRALVLAAYTATCEPEPEEDADDPAYDEPPFGPTSVESCDIAAWEDLIECLADRILWDRDYLMATQFMDQPPERAAAQKTYMGIDDEYFSSAGPDALSPTAIAQAFDRLSDFRA